jgi:hypothetical protein
MTEVNSKKLEVLIALTELLQEITPITGVHDFDLSSSVFRGRTVFSDTSDPLPLVSILENFKPSDVTHAGYNKQGAKIEWRLIIQGWVQDDVDNPTDPAYKLLAVVENKLSEIIKTNNAQGFPSNSEKYMLDGLIHDIIIGDGICRPPEPQVSAKAFFFLPITIVLTREIGVS